MLSRREKFVVELKRGWYSPSEVSILDLACSTRIFSIFRFGLFSSASRTASSTERFRVPMVVEGRSPTRSDMSGVCCACSGALESTRHNSTQSIRFKICPPSDPFRWRLFRPPGKSQRRVEMFIELEQIAAHPAVKTFGGPLGNPQIEGP